MRVSAGSGHLALDADWLQTRLVLENGTAHRLPPLVAYQTHLSRYLAGKWNLPVSVEPIASSGASDSDRATPTGSESDERVSV